MSLGKKDESIDRFVIYEFGNIITLVIDPHSDWD
jgi:hypothetical protein